MSAKSGVCVVFLNPDFAADDVDVNEREVNALTRIPAKRDQRIAIVLAVEKRLAAQFTVRVGDFRIDGENTLNGLSIRAQAMRTMSQNQRRMNSMRM